MFKFKALADKQLCSDEMMGFAIDNRANLWRLFLSHLTRSPIHHFETVPNSKKLQMTTEMWLLKVLRYRFHRKHCGKR